MSLELVIVRIHKVFAPMAPANMVFMSLPYAMAHPNEAVVLPSLYGVFRVDSFQRTKVGDEKFAFKSSA